MKSRRSGGRTSVYAFHLDHHCLFLGQKLRPWLGAIRGEFVFTVLLVVAVEAALLAWPIVATVIWGARAFLTWIHFLYVVRVALLLVGLGQVRYPQRLWGTGDYSLGWNTVRLSGGFSAYGSLAWWVRATFLHGILLTAIFVLVALGVLPVFLQDQRRWPMLLWGLSLGFHVVVLVESLVSPFALWRLGIHRPVSAAYRKARQRGSEARPRRLREIAQQRDRAERLAAVAQLKV